MTNFTKNLAEFFKEALNDTDDFCSKIEDCKDYSDILRCLETPNELKTFLGVDNLKDEIEDLEDKIEDLEDEIEDLEDENIYLKKRVRELEYEEDECELTFKPITYWDEEKYLLFLTHHHKFTSWEFEKLLTEQNK
jgi:predicted  nucleic acid-binding Zn-ribbon protein